MKYSEYLMDTLRSQGYTTCFFVGGGNIMHLVEAARQYMNCIPVVNEVSAGIAAEYFNISNRSSGLRAFALVTAGPGLTNIMTAIGAAWMESHELLVLGGQARTEFLSRGSVRQMGHQEIDGVQLVNSITNYAARLEEPVDASTLIDLVSQTHRGRKGPVFIELCLDVSATFEQPHPPTIPIPDRENLQTVSRLLVEDIDGLLGLWNESERPLLLVGSGLEFDVFSESLPALEKLTLPVATSWNAVDYIDYDSPIYAGRPDTYGMRWANVILQQADLVIACGTRLGLQQTGFNWQDFAPIAHVVHIDIDPGELEKRNPKRDMKILADINKIFPELVQLLSSEDGKKNDRDVWLNFISETKHLLPAAEPENQIFEGFVNPYEFVTELSLMADASWKIIPCSSGGSYTAMMQAFQQKTGQLLPNNKGLASMGYGLAGAIGVAVASPDATSVLVEGDGGFAQNLSELGTVSVRRLNLKIFITDNLGYASIRISQRAYFGGNYIGCDRNTGLGLPLWEEVFAAYGIPAVTVSGALAENLKVRELIEMQGPAAVILRTHQEQPFLPKLSSRIFPDGSMKSNPIHLMDPPLPPEVAEKVLRFLPDELRG